MGKGVKELAVCAVIAVAPQARAADAGVEPVSDRVVQTMLWLADVKPADVVYALGCADARLVITAVRRFGARAVCIDADHARIVESEENARRAGVAGRIRFINEHFSIMHIGQATVVMLLLSPGLNLELRPKLLDELKPGTRVVSYGHGMGDWKPELTAHVRSGGLDRPVYLWSVPVR